MKIGIISDTHGHLEIIRKIIYQAPPVSMWMHAGDFASDANEIERLTGLTVYSVIGNSDKNPDTTKVKIDEFMELEGFNIWLTHGNRYLRTGGTAELAWWAKKLEQDIVIFGHTHVPFLRYYPRNCAQIPTGGGICHPGDVTLLNPGSPISPREGSRPSFAVMEIVAGKLPQVEFINLK